jgi:predicted acylesterase/phospholipase RssA
MTIKHLVFAGGGSAGFGVYGVLKYLEKRNYWNINNILSIYATSISTILATGIILKYDWATLDNYFVKRPWDKIINIKPLDIINLWRVKGIFNEDIIKLVLSPLLKAKDLSEDITLKDLYEYSKIEFHLYSTNINEFIPTKVDISHKTHPNLELYKAITMSLTLPIIFSPICDNSGCYIDGGLLNNFPLNDCIANHNNIDEILAINTSSEKSINNTDKDTILPYYLYNLFNGMRRLISIETNQLTIPNLIDCKLQTNNLNDWKRALYDDNIRQKIIDIGEKYGESFLESQENNFIIDPSNSTYLTNEII